MNLKHFRITVEHEIKFDVLACSKEHAISQMEKIFGKVTGVRPKKSNFIEPDKLPGVTFAAKKVQEA